MTEKDNLIGEHGANGFRSILFVLYSEHERSENYERELDYRYGDEDIAIDLRDIAERLEYALGLLEKKRYFNSQEFYFGSLIGIRVADSILPRPWLNVLEDALQEEATDIYETGLLYPPQDNLRLRSYAYSVLSRAYTADKVSAPYMKFVAEPEFIGGNIEAQQYDREDGFNLVMYLVDKVLKKHGKQL